VVKTSGGFGAVTTLCFIIAGGLCRVQTSSGLTRHYGSSDNTWRHMAVIELKLAKAHDSEGSLGWSKRGC
jgi:hypothetical protein